MSADARAAPSGPKLHVSNAFGREECKRLSDSFQEIADSTSDLKTQATVHAAKRLLLANYAALSEKVSPSGPKVAAERTEVNDQSPAAPRKRESRGGRRRRKTPEQAAAPQ